MVSEKPIKFRGPAALNRSREIPRFRDKFRPEVANDVISGVAVAYVGMDVRVKVNDYRSNGS